MIEVVKSTPVENYTEPDGLEAFAVFDAGVLCGTILFYIKADKLHLSDIKIQKEIAGLNQYDVLLRAAAAYAREKGALKVQCKNRKLEDKLLPLGFDGAGRTVTASIEELLKKQCAHGEA